MLEGERAASASTVDPAAVSGERARLVRSEIGAVDLTDLLLWLVACGRPRAVALEPLTAGHVLRVDGGDGYEDYLRLPTALGEAVVARLAVIAEIPLGATSGSVLGRVRLALRHGSASAALSTEILVAVRVVDEGLAVEIHRLASATLAPPPPAVIDVADASEAEIGKYRLERELGRGGMGIVYLARHVALDKPVAVKVLHPTASDDPLVTAQFVIEARAACRARHPGIVDVTDFGVMPDGRAYLVMEYVDAPTLTAVLEREGPLAPERVLLIAKRMAEALSKASAHGVVHRDLSPSNVFLCPGDQPKIGDFGVAKIVGTETDEAPGSGPLRVVGTAAYMSPEQGLGDAVDARTDIYALGCVMYRMLTGKVPFSGGSLMAILAKHVHEAPPPMVSPHGAIAPAVERVVWRALAKKPAERYQTAEEMRVDLERAERVIAREGIARFLPR